MKEPAYIVKLREYAKGELDEDHLRALEGELYGTNDRAVVILYAALVENALQRLIANGMRKDINSADRRELFETFERVISLAFALNLVGSVSRKDLDLIRFIRNQFAHSPRPLHFKVPEVIAACAALKFPDLPGARKLIGPLDRPMAVIVAAEKAAEEDAANPDAKTRYEMACHNLIYRMVVLIDAPKEVATKLFGAEVLP